MNRLAVVLLGVLLAGQVWAIDCKQITTKYVKAAQQGDYKTLVGMSEIYQNNSKIILKDYPKYKVESALAELFENEKKHVVKQMFTPSAKWKILETKKIKIPIQRGKSADGCTAYVQTEYADDDNDPGNFDTLLSFQKDRKVKSTVTTLAFNMVAGYIYGSPAIDSDMTQYWDSLTKETKDRVTGEKARKDEYEKQEATEKQKSIDARNAETTELNERLAVESAERKKNPRKPKKRTPVKEEQNEEEL